MSRGKTNTRTRTAVVRSKNKTAPAREVQALPYNKVLSPKGEEVELKYIWDTDIYSTSRAWVVRMLEAHVQGKPSGYLKISYIPRHLMEEVIPEPFYYAMEMNGSYLGIKFMLEETPEEQWGREELIKAISDVALYDEMYLSQKPQDATLEELTAMWKKVKKASNKKHQARYEKFLHFWLDKPLVDQIGVYEENEKGRYIDGDAKQDIIELPDFRGQGIGSTLYQVGAKWMAANKMHLWESDNQTDDAINSWQRHETHGLTSKEKLPEWEKPGTKSRRYLNARKITINKAEEQ